MYNFIKKIRPISAFNYLRYYFLRFVRETGKLFWLRTRYFKDDINLMEKNPPMIFYKSILCHRTLIVILFFYFQKSVSMILFLSLCTLNIFSFFKQNLYCVHQIFFNCDKSSVNNSLKHEV